MDVKITALILLWGLITLLPTASAEDPNDPILRAIADLELTDDQKTPFGDLMQGFFADIRGAIRRELQKVDGRDKSKAIRKRIEKLFKKLDEPVSGILREDQWGSYLRYKQAVAVYIRNTASVRR